MFFRYKVFSAFIIINQRNISYPQGRILSKYPELWIMWQRQKPCHESHPVISFTLPLFFQLYLKKCQIRCLEAQNVHMFVYWTCAHVFTMLESFIRCYSQIYKRNLLLNDAFRKYQLLDIIFIVSKNSPNVAERYLESASTILFSSLNESYHVWKSNYR